MRLRVYCRGRRRRRELSSRLDSLLRGAVIIASHLTTCLLLLWQVVNTRPLRVWCVHAHVCTLCNGRYGPGARVRWSPCQ